MQWWKKLFFLSWLVCLFVKGMAMQCKCELPTLPDKNVTFWVLLSTCCTVHAVGKQNMFVFFPNGNNKWASFREHRALDLSAEFSERSSASQVEVQCQAEDFRQQRPCGWMCVEVARRNNNNHHHLCVRQLFTVGAFLAQPKDEMYSSTGRKPSGLKSV